MSQYAVDNSGKYLTQLPLTQMQSDFTQVRTPMLFHPTYSDFVQLNEHQHQIFSDTPQVSHFEQSPFKPER